MRLFLITLCALSTAALSGCGPADPAEEAAVDAEPAAVADAAIEDDVAQADAMRLSEWRVRPDDPTADREQITFERADDGVHVALGPAAIFYNPERTSSGTYRAHATFVQNEPAEHPEAYGLFFGGSELQAEDQHYSYFEIRQTGEYLIKLRRGDETRTLVGWTEHPAIRTIDESGEATNELGVAVGTESVRFLVNGEVVETLPRERLDTEGVVGLRVNHRLDVTVTEFGIEPVAD